jgi:hypothetical protein
MLRNDTKSLGSLPRSEKPVPRLFYHEHSKVVGKFAPHSEAMLPNAGENDMIPITLEEQQLAFGGGNV